MALQREVKRAYAAKQIEAIRNVAQTAPMAATVWYRGLTASEMYELRVRARQEGVYIKVIRNTLAEMALKESSFACLSPTLQGPVLLAFSLNEVASVARLLKNFSKAHDKLVIRHLALDGQLIDGKDLNSVADLPTREEALSRLIAVLQAPIKQMLYVLKEPGSKLVRTISALKDR